MTLGELRRILAEDRLHDPDYAIWTQENLDGYLNASIRNTLARTRSKQGSQSTAVVSGTHTYDASPVHGLTKAVVRLGDNLLDRKQMGSMAAITENWDALPSDIPDRFIPVGGSWIRVAPTPDADAAGIIGSVTATPVVAGSGYAVNDILTLAGGTGGQAKVSAIGGGGTVTTVELNSSTDDETGKTEYNRGTGYSTGTKATTGGTGTGCTISIASLAKLEIYGPSSIDDLVFETACTMAITGNLVTDVAHGLTVGDAIEFGGTTGGVTPHTTYYVVSTPSADTFTFSASVGGAAFTITANGSNTYGPSDIEDIAEARTESIVQGALDLALQARPHMTGAAAGQKLAHDYWLEECALIREDTGAS